MLGVMLGCPIQSGRVKGMFVCTRKSESGNGRKEFHIACPENLQPTVCFLCGLASVYLTPAHAACGNAERQVCKGQQSFEKVFSPNSETAAFCCFCACFLPVHGEEYANMFAMQHLCLSLMFGWASCSAAAAFIFCAFQGKRLPHPTNQGVWICEAGLGLASCRSSRSHPGTRTGQYLKSVAVRIGHECQGKHRHGPCAHLTPSKSDVV